MKLSKHYENKKLDDVKDRLYDSGWNQSHPDNPVRKSYCVRQDPLKIRKPP